MKNIFYALTFSLLASAFSPAFASTVCASTSFTNTDCGFLITISSTGSASVSAVTGATAFNGPQMFVDGTSDPGNDGSLVGVINKSSQALASFTLTGSGANAGIFDFSFNGICLYTNAAYCSTSPTGYEGPTTTFGNLKSTVLFQTTTGTVTFDPTLGSQASTFFAIEDNPSDIAANGGLSISNVTFATSTATPEPATIPLLGLGIGLLFVLNRLRTAKA